MPKQSTLCKRQSRENETAEHYELHRANGRENKWMKRSAETPEHHEMRLRND
jgi:hypothetical protein